MPNLTEEILGTLDYADTHVVYTQIGRKHVVTVTKDGRTTEQSFRSHLEALGVFSEFEDEAYEVRAKTPAVPIVNVTPIGRYADGKPRYEFLSPFSNVRTLDVRHETAEAAWNAAKDWAARYQRDNRPGGMAEAIGVTKDGSRFRAVVCSAYSGS